MSKLLWKYVHKYRRPADVGEQALFIGRFGEPLQIIGIQHILERVRRESGLDGVKFSAHVFGHTFARWYLEKGGDLFRLSREMGHSDVQITKIYLQDYSSREARKDHTTFSPISSIELKKKHQKRKKAEMTKNPLYYLFEWPF